ncbi:unnamed protein product, partial [Enterobius vermicularis]|uniref:C-type lectin domain-containing protein n=1 Tax=Enterobius vermicularis TaxID=51028 RepID=A0A0N4USS0_ENTVE
NPTTRDQWWKSTTKSPWWNPTTTGQTGQWWKSTTRDQWWNPTKTGPWQNPTTAYPTKSTTTAPYPGIKSSTCGCEDESLIRGVNYWLDVVFVVDSTDVVRDEDFYDIKTFISLFGNLQIGTASYGDPRYSRIAIVNAGAEAETIADLDRFESGTDLKNAVAQELNKKGGTKFNIQAGKVNLTRSEKKVDGMCSLAAYLQETTTLITIGLKMAGTKNFPQIDIADNCNRFENSVDMMMNVLRAFCRANCHCPTSYKQFATEDRCEPSGECVAVHQLSLPYRSATEICHQDGAVVADAATYKKERFLQSLHATATFSPFWIGLNYINGKYVWSNNETLNYYDYNNWCTADYQPKISSGKNCVYEDRCGEYATGWFTAECGMMLPTYYFACQKNACSVNSYCE